MPAKLLRTELLVCPEKGCQRVGQIPNSGDSMKGWCSGGAANPHKKCKMVWTPFVEDRSRAKEDREAA